MKILSYPNSCSLSDRSLSSASGSKHPKFLQRLWRLDFTKSAHAFPATDSIFPFPLLSNTELRHTIISRQRCAAYRSYRLVLERNGTIKAFVKSAARNRLLSPIDTCPRRLIDTDTLELVEFDKHATVPAYAILSHRWILEREVVYEEFIRPQAETKSKSGYQKIEAACLQARKDGIRYLWVDTCCIMQGNPVDVAVNITSMFAFYQNAEVCYAYLVDITGCDHKEMFARPRAWWKQYEEPTEWFSRGWTLQELVAPKTVIFYNKFWECIGDKYQLRRDIRRVTTIPAAVLSGEQSIRDVDVITRMSWSYMRVTTKRQDQAFCLQGLLGVTVEPNYEESYYISINRLGEALLEAHPELEQLGLTRDLFQAGRGVVADDQFFGTLLQKRWAESRRRILKGRPPLEVTFYRLPIDDMTEGVIYDSDLQEESGARDILPFSEDLQRSCRRAF
ncbi:hypothetical protein D9758_006934 [Tetrapyrgos nigripes]|uniref:Heterokaryon incompatibility domain-containing protein n=1 Tax=Tetrapyrgos nigripes TaxID=182062 RepID=A0A8H5GSR5_9AGAR|nr:hypothetical protein D9758_006934 [Tetrapyrgos nigripes]